MVPTINFGEHVTIDGYGGQYPLLNSKEAVLSAMEDLMNGLGMNKLAEPVVYFAAGNDDKDPGGWSGYVVIQESHISIHTFPARGFVSADVYTCKNGMDIDYIVSFFIERFGLSDVEHNFIKRGTRYPLENIHFVKPSMATMHGSNGVTTLNGAGYIRTANSDEAPCFETVKDAVNE